MTDLDRIRCFKCGEYGHMKRACQSQKSRRDRASGPVSEEHRAACYVDPIPPLRPLSEIADYQKAAAEARKILAEALGRPLDTQPYVITPFRQAMGLPPRTESDLREIALQQAQEARALAERAAAKPAPTRSGLGWPAGSR